MNYSTLFHSMVKYPTKKKKTPHLTKKELKIEEAQASLPPRVSDGSEFFLVAITLELITNYFGLQVLFFIISGSVLAGYQLAFKHDLLHWMFLILLDIVVVMTYALQYLIHSNFKAIGPQLSQRFHQIYEERRNKKVRRINIPPSRASF